MNKQCNGYRISKTLQYWFNDTNKEDSINQINNTSLATFAKNIGVNFEVLRRFLIKNNINVKINKNNRKIDTKIKRDIVLLAKKIGAAKASKEYNISDGTIYRWAKEIGIDIHQCKKGVSCKFYSDAEKESSVQLAIKYGVMEASKRTNISNTSIRTWADKFGVRDLIISKSDRYDDTYKSKIIEEAYKNGISATAAKYHVGAHAIRSWINKDSEETGREYSRGPMRSWYDEEVKLKAIELADEIGVLPAARKLSIPNVTIYRWCKRYKSKTIQKEKKI